MNKSIEKSTKMLEDGSVNIDMWFAFDQDISKSRGEK